MKKIIVLVSICLINIISYSQEKFNEGILLSKTIMSSDNAQVSAQFESLGDLQAITYVKDGKSRGEVSNPLTGDVVTITNEEEILILMSIPGAGKVYQKQSLELAEETLESINLTKGVKTKTILGYVCDQYTVTLNQQGIEMEMELFTTDKIPNAVSQQTAILGNQLKGFPLFMTIKMNQFGSNLIITNEVVDIKKESVSDDKFKMIIPEGYEKLPGQ